MVKILAVFGVVFSLQAANFSLSDENLAACKDTRCKNILNHYADFMKNASNQGFWRKLELVNSYINSLMPRYDDFYNTNVDTWSTRGEFLRSAGGDCEEYAITKLASLRDLGIKNQSCLLVAKEKFSGGYHMVLAVWQDLKKEPVVLDNLSFRILSLSKRYDLQPDFCIMDGQYYKFKKDGVNLERKNIRMRAYEELIEKEKKEKFWKP